MLESGNSRILVKYNITLIAHVTLGGTKPHSPSVMMLPVVAFTKRLVYIVKSSLYNYFKDFFKYG